MGFTSSTGLSKPAMGPKPATFNDVRTFVPGITSMWTENDRDTLKNSEVEMPNTNVEHSEWVLAISSG